MIIFQNTSSLILRITLYFSVLLFSITINAQEVKVSANLDTNQIKIGNQAHISLKATAPKGVKVVFPQPKDTIIEKIEIVSVGKTDTMQSGNLYTYKQDLVITSFDSGFYAIPPFKFQLKGDSSRSFETEALLFIVQTIPVDTTLAIKTIKAPLDPVWSIFEIQNEILIGLSVVLIIISLVFFLKRKKKVDQFQEAITPSRPAHEIAIEALNELKGQKLWQQGRVKEYHIIISDTVRTYIEQRYAVGAMEMTSEEILRSLRLIINDVNLKNKLSSILILSDMVKFAKELPLPNENELSWEHAIEFVKQTANNVEKEEGQI
jgi:hypothetical protein